MSETYRILHEQIEAVCRGVHDPVNADAFDEDGKRQFESWMAWFASRDAAP